ncbi:MAG: hypothetical protein WCV62_05255 [Candidatus Peribacteraceae bacterium]|jgi:hypothetical protein
MALNPQKPSSKALPLRIPSGRRIYDALMAQIEPDLVTATIPTLENTYKDETPEQNAERRKRYLAAFAKYDRAFAALTKELREAVQQCRTHAVSKKSKKDDEASLLSDFSPLPAFPAE